MKKLLAPALLGLAALGWSTNGAPAHFRCRGCSSCTIKLKQYNAFSEPGSGGATMRGRGCPAPLPPKCCPPPPPPAPDCGPGCYGGEGVLGTLPGPVPEIVGEHGHGHTEGVPQGTVTPAPTHEGIPAPAPGPAPEFQAPAPTPLPAPMNPGAAMVPGYDPIRAAAYQRGYNPYPYYGYPQGPAYGYPQGYAGYPQMPYYGYPQMPVSGYVPATPQRPAPMGVVPTYWMGGR